MLRSLVAPLRGAGGLSFSANTCYFRLIDGLIVWFMAFSDNFWHYIRLSAHGSWPRGADAAPGPRGTPWAPSQVRVRRSFGPRAPGRPLVAMSHEPRAEYNAKN